MVVVSIPNNGNSSYHGYAYVNGGEGGSVWLSPMQALVGAEAIHGTMAVEAVAVTVVVLVVPTNQSPSYGGGGGGGLITGTNQNNSSGMGNGHGYVIINKL